MRQQSVVVFALAVLLTGCAAATPPATPIAESESAGEGERPLQPGVPVEGMLTDTDPVWGSNGRFHLYRFDARAGERFGIDLRSDDFDAYLVLGDRTGGVFNPLEQDDDGGDGLNSRIRFVAPRDGTYRVLAQALSDDGRGRYTIELSRLPEPQPAVAVPIGVGSSTLGVLSEDDAVHGDDDTYYDLYTFQGAAGQRYAIAMSSPAFDTYLHVGTGTGDAFHELASNDDAGGTDSRVVFVPDRSGTYSIRASSYSEGSTGDYSLSVTELPPPGPLTITPIEVGEVVSGTLDMDDPVAEDGSYFDLYAFRGTEGQRIAVTLRSADFDSYLDLGTMTDGEFLSDYSDDDSGGGLDSRIVVTLPRTGEVVIRANSLSAAEIGGYTVVVEELPPSGPASVRSIEPGQTLQGRLEPTDAMLDDGSYYDIYTFHAEAGERVRITIRSDDFDAFLAFGNWRDGDLSIISTDDDGGGGLDSELTIPLRASGMYAVRANSLRGGEEGSYTISLQRE